MEAQDNRERLIAAAAGLLVATLLLVRLAGFGIWDPWELSAADLGRRLMEGDRPPLPHAGPWLVGLGFSLFGVTEWAGRLPIALCGLLTAALGYALSSRYASRRAGAYTVLVIGTSPLFLFNARTMLGEAPSFAVQAGIALCAFAAVAPGEDPPRRRLLWLAGCAASSVLGVWMRGALLGVLPPLAAASTVALLTTQPKRGAGTSWRLELPAALLVALCALLLLLVGRDVIADRAAFSPWLGGKPVGGVPPSFDAVIGRAFHAFGVWSALLPLAIAQVLVGGTGRQSSLDEPQAEAGSIDRAERETALRWFLLLWIAAGYAAQTLFIARYGDRVTFLPVVAMSALVALLLRDAERSESSQWGFAVAAGMLALLVVRDYAEYPKSPVRGIPLDDFTVPEVFNPKAEWGLVVGIFTITAVLAFAAQPLRQARPDLSAPYRLMREQFQRGRAERAWLAALALALLGLLATGVIAWAAPNALSLRPQSTKWLRALCFVPLAIPPLVAAGQLVFFAFGKWFRWRMVPLLAAGALAGGYAAQGFMPALSAHFSPREVYDTYNALAKPGESLAEYKVGGRAAAYYAKGQVVEVGMSREFVEHLSSEERRWGVLPAEELATVDRLYRRRHGRHLFVADARSARVVLVTNQDVEGRTNENPLAQHVLKKAPDVPFKVGVNFDGKIELIGYDLELPHDDYVAAGEDFTITWYFRSLAPVTGKWRIFVHIDGQGKRVHGDHDPIDGGYPVHLWDRGDVIVDRQSVEVPPDYPAGQYSIMVGFYLGERRLKITEGPRDDTDRATAGVLLIR